MFQFGAPGALYHQPAVSSGSHLGSQDITLHLRQQPKEALVTTEGKEKARKPVDPPPIIQLTVGHNADPQQHFLQSPYLFMCTSLYKVDKNEACDAGANKCLAGSLVSSLHRLKDVDNKDGGFFVFGDISVKMQGTFRLHFSLFDLRKDSGDVQYLGSITSEPFRVLLQKDFKGMDESTYLSRAFSDQGVRLRLRKEPRAIMNRGTKRAYPTAVDTPIIRPNMGYYDESPTAKRYRVDPEDQSDHSVVSGGGYSNSFSSPSTNYPVSSSYPSSYMTNYAITPPSYGIPQQQQQQQQQQTPQYQQQQPQHQQQQSFGTSSSPYSSRGLPMPSRYLFWNNDGVQQ
ncbi:hypothetical protein BS50DRAFT_162188 [Corynespora cassiicola Philippines]|uniref:Velvet domain-containing protein n=1 Tax=Corynespora cassiicola Philippines TaxID=1448308 RepID=A0A2T2N6Y0_CORCC|nr:hypothetical protein BS50DRAFT_162188 [Corynespora cassiicola Philippines]